MDPGKNAKTKYQAELSAYHKASPRHVLVLEADMAYSDKCVLFHQADIIRKAGNELVSIMRERLIQLYRTKRYRKLKELYGKYADDRTKLKGIADQMAGMQALYNVTWEYCRKSMVPIAHKYGIQAVFGLTKAEDVWRAVEKCLYGDGGLPRFTGHGDLPCIRAKQPVRGIIISSKDGGLSFKTGDIGFKALVRDRFEQDEARAIAGYLAHPAETDKEAVKTFLADGTCIDTYRPCYVSLVCRKIRGRMRVYIHITLEGRPMPKYDKQGCIKHGQGTGIIGCDIGTQTIAYVSDSAIALKNLAERGPSAAENERIERLLYRKMDRSRRAVNPQNYNPNGTVKKGPKTWYCSKRYKRLKAKHTERCRINAENRRFAINEEMNRIRGLGSIFITEPKNSKNLQMQSRESDAGGKAVRRKRFGRSIKNRCPGYFQEQAHRKFGTPGCMYIEVPLMYRASQYDHTSDTYTKKALSERITRLSDGTIVQRDLYSAFLLYCMDLETRTIDREKCISEFENFRSKEKDLVRQIRSNNIKVFNSGINAA